MTCDNSSRKSLQSDTYLTSEQVCEVLSVKNPYDTEGVKCKRFIIRWIRKSSSEKCGRGFV